METDAPLPPGPHPGGAGPGRQLALWLLAALAATVLLMLVLRWERHHASTRFTAVGPADPRKGEALFRAKGCAHCHTVNGVGGKVGPDLTGSQLAGPDRLLAAMWNHAPQMSEQARSEEIAYPSLTHEEVVHLFSYMKTGTNSRGKTP